MVKATPTTRQIPTLHLCETIDHPFVCDTSFIGTTKSKLKQFSPG
jgi:hypothetical protein